MKAKNCLIFGGSGQIGRNLIRKLTNYAQSKLEGENKVLNIFLYLQY